MKVQNLMETPLYASLATANQPDDSRMVIVQDYGGKENLVFGAHYVEGEWYEHSTQTMMNLHPMAVWLEAPYITVWNPK